MTHSSADAEKRRVLYASLLRYAQETIPLRERAINRVVSGALIGASAERPLRLGEVIRVLSGRSKSAVFRQEEVLAALERLVSERVAIRTEFKKKPAYVLSERGLRDVEASISDREKLFESVLERSLRDLDPSLDKQAMGNVLWKFLFECVASAGQHIAQSVVGAVAPGELGALIDAERAFRHASQGLTLLPAQAESVRARCLALLSSSDPLFERLRFVLIQGFYFSELVGLGHNEFDPLSAEAFTGATLYLDTNVLLEVAAERLREQDQFAEVQRICRRLGVKLVVTRATINELVGAAHDKVQQLRTVVERIPTPLARRTEDQLLLSFMDAREDRPEMTADEFLAPIIDIERSLNSWNVEIDERTEQQLVGGIEVSNARAAIAKWGTRKGPRVVEHDVALWAAVMRLRGEGRKGWALTRDQSLARAAAELEETPPFCMLHVAFLQGISPFVTSPEEEQTFADAFATLMGEQLRPLGGVFDAAELALIAEMHADVMATPGEQLVLAFDYVKLRTLSGRHYQREDAPGVSLQLRKFLGASKDDQLRALALARGEAERAAEDERGRRETAEQAAATLSQSLALTETGARRWKKRARKERSLRHEIEERLAEVERQQRLSRRAALCAGGWVVAATLWKAEASIRVTSIGWLVGRGPQMSGLVAAGWQFVAGVAGTLVALATTVALLRELDVSDERKGAWFASAAAACLFFSGLASVLPLEHATGLWGTGAVVAGSFGAGRLAARKR